MFPLIETRNLYLFEKKTSFLGCKKVLIAFTERRHKWNKNINPWNCWKLNSRRKHKTPLSMQLSCNKLYWFYTYIEHLFEHL